MALQRQISYELNRGLVGREVQVLMEYPSQESDLVMVGRHRGQAPDVDGVVYVGRGTLQPETWSLCALPKPMLMIW